MQRLEWIGDAVLCLAAREWIYRHFPERSVGSMVLREALLVSNEALAFLSIRGGLYKHLNHRDQTLPGRIDEYFAELGSKRGGLWGTSPPKPIADLVESLLGLVHVDAGFEAAQEAARHILSPVLKLLESISEDQILEHPKKRLKELGGRLVSIDTYDGGSFSKKFPNDRVWNGHQWGPPNRNRVVARVHAVGNPVIAASGASDSAAINLACTSILSTLNTETDLKNRFQATGRLAQEKLDAAKSQRYDNDSDTSDAD